MAAAFLLGNLADARQGRVGLAVVLGAAAIVVFNDPRHAAGEFVFVPVLFALAWLAGFALRERAAQAEAAEERAARAEREREENARRAVFEERVRIARELHDVVAHHVSMMGVQAGAARVVLDRDRDKAKEALSAIESSSRQAVAELHRLLGFLRQAGDRDDLAPQPGLGRASAAGGEHARLRSRRRGQHRGRAARAAADGRRLGVPDRPGGADEHAQALGRVARRRARALLARRARARDRRRRPSRTAARRRASGGLGLIGMRERAALHGGQLSAGPAAGGGFAVKVRLPTPAGAL